jgi:hypothetical protein
MLVTCIELNICALFSLCVSTCCTDMCLQRVCACGCVNTSPAFGCKQSAMRGSDTSLPKGLTASVRAAKGFVVDVHLVWHSTVYIDLTDTF